MPLPRGGQRRDRLPRVGASCVGGVAAMLLLAGTPAAAQTLTESFAYAYNNNPQLLAQRAALRAADEGVPQALSNWRPTVNFSGQSGYTRGGFEVANPVTGLPTPTAFSSFTFKSLNLTVTQPVYRGGRTEAQTRQAIDAVEATRAQTLGVETAVLQSVAQGYLDVVRDQNSGRGQPQQRAGVAASSSRRRATGSASAR